MSKQSGAKTLPTLETPSDKEDDMKSLMEKRLQLQKSVKEKEELLRRLNMVKVYKSKKEIDNLDESIHKWKLVTQRVLSDLYKVYESTKSNYEDGAEFSTNDSSMLKFLKKMKIDPKFVDFDIENDCFK